MKFWDEHADTMRRARLLQAAATIFAGGNYGGDLGIREAVKEAFELEEEISSRLKKEKK